MGRPSRGRAGSFRQSTARGWDRAGSSCSLHAAGRFRQSGQFARALCRPGWKQLVDLIQLESGLFADLANHGRNTELQIVIANVVDDLPVVRGQVRDGLGLGEVLGDIFVPERGLLEKTIFVYRVAFSMYFKRRHSFTSLALLVHFDIAARARVGALLAAVAQLQFDFVVFAFRQLHKTTAAAVHPAGLAIHAHAARHAALGFVANLGFREAEFDLGVGLALGHGDVFALVTLGRLVPIELDFVTSDHRRRREFFERYAAEARIDGFSGESALGNGNRDQAEFGIVTAGIDAVERGSAEIGGLDPVLIIAGMQIVEALEVGLLADGGDDASRLDFELAARLRHRTRTARGIRFAERHANRAHTDRKSTRLNSSH